MRLIRHIATATLCLGFALPVHAFETSAKAAYVMDVTTGTVLLDKNADTPMPPASMSKLMTLYVAFEAVRGIDLEVRRGQTVIAEALSPDGTEAGFARFMTQRAQQLGMTNSMFRNASGWPAEGHVMSMRDLALLARHIIEDFPEFYPMFSETEFRFDGRAPSNISNRNPLLGLGIGADGLKTGHTEQAGFGLTGSAKQGDRRVVFVISGLATAADRARESESIVNWAFRQFAQKSVLTAGQEVARAEVWMGEAPSVGLTVAEDVSTLLPVLDGGELKGEVVYTGPVRAPVAKGDVVGRANPRRRGGLPRRCATRGATWCLRANRGAVRGPRKSGVLCSKVTRTAGPPKRKSCSSPLRGATIWSG